VPKDTSPLDDRVAAARAACGWDLQVAPTVAELEPPTTDELHVLRSWDTRGWFLRSR
jgi:hypothetical protein